MTKKKKTKHQISQVFLWILVGIVGLVCVVAIALGVWMSTWKTYTSTAKGFSIKYPSSWTATEDNQAWGFNPPERPLAIYKEYSRNNTWIYMENGSK